MIQELPIVLVSGIPQRTLVAMTSAAISPFTGGQQVQDWGGRYWSYQITMARLRGRNALIMDAFLNGLGGLAGRFIFRDPAIEQNIAGTPLVASAAQVGSSLITDGWPTSATVMRAGEFFSLGAGSAMRLHQIAADVDSNASGVATLTFHPPLRSSPADNDALNVANPGVLLRLTDQAPARIGAVATYLFTLSAREAL
jgi:hypothetical protein